MNTYRFKTEDESDLCGKDVRWIVQTRIGDGGWAVSSEGVEKTEKAAQMAARDYIDSVALGWTVYP